MSRHLGPQASVADLSADVIADYVSGQRIEGIAENSIRRKLAGLRGFSRWLKENEFVTTDPWDDLDLRVQTTRSLPRAVAETELSRLLSHLCRSAGVSAGVVDESPLNDPAGATTLLGTSLMLATGVRVSELTSITCANLDVVGGSILVLGKGRRERTVYLTGRWLPSLCQRYLHLRAALNIDHQFLLFDRGYRQLTASAMRLRLNKAARRAGLDGRVTPHMLRHSAATQLIETGVDIRYVQRLLGHSSIATTEIYTRVTDVALRRAVISANVIEACLAR